MTSAQNDESLTPDYKASIDFLRKVVRVVHLVAINPNQRGQITGKVFLADGPQRFDDMRAFIEEWNARKHWNVYFTTGTVRRDLDCDKNPKARDTDIQVVTMFKVDLDPSKNIPKDWSGSPEEFVEQQRARILASLTTDLPTGVVGPPTIVLDSGGGRWGLWLFGLQYDIEKDSERPLMVARNEHLIELYRAHFRDGGVVADGVADLSRICRLVGTVNWPDKKKAAAGRTPRLASMDEGASNLERRYGPNQFDPPEGTSAARRSNGVAVTIDAANVPRVQDLDAELPSTVPPVVKRIIACGLDEMNTDPARAGWSRSEWQWWATCEMARRGVKPEVVYSILLDPDWKISESVLDKGSGAERYARRQVDRAFAEAADPELAELNARHTIALLGGVVRVLTTSLEQVPATGIVAPKTTPTAPSGMELYYANRTKLVPVPGKPEETKLVPLWQWWTRHPLSSHATGVVFAPEREVEPGVFNLWHGFAVPPAPGDCQPFLDFVRRRMANKRDDVYEYILNWMALTIQRPWEPVGTALVLYSRMTGTGKNAFVDLSLGLILGHSFLYVTAEKHLFGQFSGHLATTIALHLGEAATADSVEAEGLMKALVTDRTRMSERKGIDGVAVANCLHVLMSSNQDWILRVAPEDRRYCVVDVCEERMSKEEYDGLRKHMLSGGAAALHALLAARDITRFDVVKDRPGSVAGLRQKAHSVEGLDAAWFEFLQSGELPTFCVEREDGSMWLPSSSILDYLNRTRRPRKLYGPNLLRNLLTGPQENCKGAGMGFAKERKDGRAGPWGYAIPPLAEARRRWDERRFPYTWDDDGGAGWIRVAPQDFDVLG